MIFLPGYKIETVLAEGKKFTIYRGCRLADNLPLVFKVHNTDYPSAADIACFQQEFSLGSGIEDDHVIRYLALIRFFSPKNQGFPDGIFPEASCIIALKNNNNEIL